MTLLHVYYVLTKSDEMQYVTTLPLCRLFSRLFTCCCVHWIWLKAFTTSWFVKLGWPYLWRTPPTASCTSLDLQEVKNALNKLVSPSLGSYGWSSGHISLFQLVTLLRLRSTGWKPVKCMQMPIVYISNYSWHSNSNYLFVEVRKCAYPNSPGGARGLSVFRRQVAYPCVKYKARKVLFLCSGVLYV